MRGVPMGRKKACRICDDTTALGPINAMLESKVGQRTICEQYPQFSTFQISRHKRHLAQPTPDLADGSETDIWLRRCHDSYNQACIDGDTKARVSAISTAARTLEKLRKSEIEK